MGNSERWLIEVTGTVQGVGFRPFVYRTAHELGLAGLVRNTPEGVTIEAQGTPERLYQFVEKLNSDHPPLAQIQCLDHSPISIQPGIAFTIVESHQGDGNLTPAISPDIATCDDCLRELISEEDRRHSYAFTNCTNCGPRYTIIEGFPYDRSKTSMKDFIMCQACRSEYDNPSDRRFHAQPNACPSCGPQLNIPIDEALACIAQGNIVAIKGLGGFHLACDATNDEAVKRLRRRKRRDMKPFAIMVRDLDAAVEICHISDEEAHLLTSPQRPIVLLKKRDNIPIAESVAPDNKCLGVMLPYTPLHHLFFGRSPLFLVMTSANFSEEPIISDNNEATSRLADVADTFLYHNRPIHMRTDDSVIRPVGRHNILMRRARGYVPSPVPLPFKGPNVLALGGDIKNAICITNGSNAYLSQHIGDLANIETHSHFEDVIEHLCNLLKVEPEVIACDMHRDYYSTQYANRRISEQLYSIQHHHAHIASCMAENGLANQKVIGIALDGAGYGPDGTIWGGEILRADYEDFERLARIKPVMQPGGDLAAREPWRMAVAYLRELSAKTILNDIPENEIDLVEQAMEKDINCPLTSSLGRLFDAVAAILGIATHNAFEGHAAMLLEQVADDKNNSLYSWRVGAGSSSTAPLDQRRRPRADLLFINIDFQPTIQEIVQDSIGSVKISNISAKFHNTVVAAFAEVVKMIGGDEPVCLSGGCMQNAWLLLGLTKSLEAQGRTVYTHDLVPPNDGGLALGQAAIAIWRNR